MNKWYRIVFSVLTPLFLIQCMDKENPLEEQLRKDKNTINQHVKENGIQGEYVLNDIFKSLVTAGPDTIRPFVNSGVRVHYKMSLLDGAVIDSSNVFYQHGQGFYFSGWEAAVSTMSRKEVATFLIPSFYAYGKSTATKGNISIPPNSIIRLDARLSDVVSQRHVPMAYAFYKNIEGESRSSGLFYSITDSTEGVNPKEGQTVTVKYKGYFLNGYEFDKSENLKFVVGSNTMIKGFSEAMPLMRLGEKATVVIPSNLAYGDEIITHEGQVKIPANATLIFDLELLDVK